MKIVAPPYTTEELLPAADQSDTPHGIGEGFPERVRHEVTEFLAARAHEITDQGTDVDEWVQVAVAFLQQGKCVRPRFAYLGWLARADASYAALRAAASFELLHAFALIQDDVMDESDLRRGSPTVHRTLSAGYAARRGPRFGESAATLLADLCLVWASQMLRTCGLPTTALNRAFPSYDGMRQELAVGQYLDLHTSHRDEPSTADVHQIARRKSARYTVTGPLVVGATLAGAEPALRRAFSEYGDAIGEAFQMRDDLLGLFGDPAVTGKPAGGDLAQGKVTTVVARAFEHAGPAQRQALHRVLDEGLSGTEHVEQLRELVIDTGAATELENEIADKVESGTDTLHTITLPERSRSELAAMAEACAHRGS